MLYKQLLKPLLFTKNAEEAHDLAIRFASLTNESPFLRELAYQVYGRLSDNETLSQTFWGLTFPNPIGLAAGFDKNGYMPLAMQALGFGFVEVGSVTARASEGNPKPRAFRLPKDHSLINRMGLNNEGADVIIERLKKAELDIPLGINIAKTNDASIHGDHAIRDYLYSYERAIEAADYITVNISCPNTGEGKTFEDPQALHDLLEALSPTTRITPTLVKFSVDTPKDTLIKLIGICEDAKVDGYVATNTSSGRSGLATPIGEIDAIGNGGLSGKAIEKQSTQVISWIHEVLQGSKPIIGVGGVSSVESALRKMEAGANLLQVYTGLIYEGPGLIKSIRKGLAKTH